MIFTSQIASPVGKITLCSDGEFLIGLAFEEERHSRDRSGAITTPNPVLLDAERQLHEYFAGWRKTFDLPLSPEGTVFQQRVWQQLLKIPFGETISYLELARRVGNEKAVRAVGMANGRNPIGLIIPCHRVIGSNGNLIGYGGGLPRKEFLLRHEGVRLRGGQGSMFPAPNAQSAEQS